MNVQSQKGLKGTPIYMAPEILSEEKYSKSSDVYAFGFIVYEIMTCSEPIQNCNLITLIKKICIEGYRPNISNDVPPSYCDLIERCWSQEPSERPTFDEIVQELKTNDKFISDVIDSNEFFDYVDFIDNSQVTFNSRKEILRFSDFIKAQGRIKNVKPILFNENTTYESTIDDDQQQENEKGNEKILEKSTTTAKIEIEIIESNQEANLSKINENDQNSSFDNLQKISEMDSIPAKVKESDVDITENKESKHNLMYPFFEFTKLSKANQNLVEEAEHKPGKQFDVGRYLIEGENGFPENIKLGIKYIEQSANQKNNDAMFYYIKLLLKGKIVKEDLSKAEEYVTKFNTTNDSRRFLLQGLLYIKKNRFKEAVKSFLEGMKYGELSCMYQYGKLLFIGEGTRKNEKKAIENINKSKERGYSKSDQFLKSFNKLKEIKNFSKLSPETQLILITNNIKNIRDNQQSETQFKRIETRPKTTEKLFFNKSLKSPKFIEILKLYENISFEISYPSSSFKSIIDLVFKLHQKNIRNMKIGIVITTFSEPFIDECFSENISYYRIDSSISSIPANAFFGCSSLTQIIIPSSVTEIGSFAFFECSSLTQITIPSTITQIRYSTFSRCSSLTQISIPSSVTQIQSNAFSGCSSLTQISIPSSVTEIGSSAFLGIKTLKIIGDLQKILSSVFKGCSSLTQISIPSSVTEIGSSAFSECSSLTQITIPSSVTKIGSSAFSGCSSLTQITIPSFLKTDGIELKSNVKIIKI